MRSSLLKSNDLATSGEVNIPPLSAAAAADTAS